MDYVLIFVSCALITITFIAIWNVFIFPKLTLTPQPIDETVFVSILIPARNEALVIGDTVRSILSQTYTNFELLILDDNSDDQTSITAKNASNGDKRLKVITGTPLPAGWAGKNYACHQLSQQAQGAILLFTDADTQWQSQTLASLLVAMQTAQADLLTVWPNQQAITWSERLIVPLMMFAVISYLPIWFVHYAPFSVFAAANGQCMIWRRSAYQRVNGHIAVAADVLEDVKLARLAKKQRQKLWMVQGANLLACRMYKNWREVSYGYAKNILAGYGNSVPALLISTIFHWLIFILPWLLLFIPEYQLWALCLIVMGIGVRALSAAASGQRIFDALAMPLSVILMTRIAFQSIYWHFTGGPRWKGRILQPRPLGRTSHGE
jgi:chlorobactene glucosyltransferase